MSIKIDRDPLRRSRYAQGGGIYRIIPAGVVRPESSAELRLVLEWAQAEGSALIPRGAGSAMDGSNVGEGVVVDLTRLGSGACEIDAVTRSARVAPSLRGGQLQQRAGLHGLRFPPDPASGHWATIGGMVSTNAAGPRTVRYGSTRDWVEALTLETFQGPLELRRGVMPDLNHSIGRAWQRELQPALRQAAGVILRAWPELTKNSFGYNLGAWLQSADLLDLVIGSEGTLGLISEVVLKLDPVPKHRISLLLVVKSRRDLIPAVSALRQVEASTVEFFDRTFLQLVDAPSVGSTGDPLRRGGGAILADLEGDQPAALIAAAEQVVTGADSWLLHSQVATQAEAIDQLWELRRGASPALARMGGGRRSLQVIEDGVVPLPRLADYLDQVESICQDQGVPVVLFGHAGNGHVHANLLPDIAATDWLERVRRIYLEVNRIVLELGGVPSGEHGAGRLRAPLLESGYGPEAAALCRRLKQLFDPDNLLNPGVILGQADPLEKLKIGADAVPLPEGVAAWLQDIEAKADWERERW